MLKNSKKCWIPSWARPMEVSCFEKFEIGSEQLAKVWKFSDSMYNYLQRPNQVLAGRLPPMTLKTCTLGHPKCLKMLTAYWGKTYKGQMVWNFWDLIAIKELPKVWKLSDAMHHLQVLAGKLPKYTNNLMAGQAPPGWGQQQKKKNLNTKSVKSTCCTPGLSGF